MTDGGEDLSKFYHGIRTNTAGRAMAYALATRTDMGFRHERIIPARHILPIARHFAVCTVAERAAGCV